MALIIRTAVTAKCPRERPVADPASLPQAGTLGPCDAVRQISAASPTAITGSTYLYNSFIAMLRNDDGATLVEYSLVVALIAVVCIAAVTSLGNKINNKLNNAANSL
jgi:pilus assembly protein Flp/PilA